MLRPALLFLLTTLHLSAFAQAPDSLYHHYDSLAKTKLSHLDSSSSRINHKVDSLQSKFNNLLNPTLRLPTANKISAPANIPDSLKAVHDLDSMKRGLTHKIDSLKSLNLPTEKYTRKLDSLNNISPAKYIQQAQAKVNNIQDKIDQPIDNIGNKVNQPVDKVESKINEGLSAINKEGGNTGLPQNVDLNKNIQLPDTRLDTSIKTDANLNIPGTDIKVDNPLGDLNNPVAGQLDKVGDAKDKLTDITQAPQEKIDQLKAMDEVKNIRENAGKANELTDKAQSYGQEAKNIANGDLGEVKSIPDAIENKAKNLDEIKELEKHQGLGELDQYKDMAQSANDPEAMKAQLKKQALTQAKNHFAGKEAVLKAGMDKLSKLKQKYPDMPTVEQMKKRVYNAMNGKPFIERIVPGVTFQFQKTANVIVDVNPSLSYRISGVWNAGIGWNERLSFRKWNQLEKLDRIYGPRAFTSVVIAKGFGVKVEGERMNTFVPANGVTVDTNGRQWVWSLFVGIKKDYRIAKNIRGNIQTLYNLYDDHDNSPYNDRLVVRMGFEFPLKKKPAKSK